MTLCIHACARVCKMCVCVCVGVGVGVGVCINSFAVLDLAPEIYTNILIILSSHKGLLADWILLCYFHF